MKYFLHDTNSFQDEKIMEVYSRFGYEGIGLFYTILEKIALQEKPIKTSALKKHLDIGKRLEKCWMFMEEIELISSNNGETFNERILSYAENYKIKREKNIERIKAWRENQLDVKNVTHSESVRNTPKVKRSKVNIYIGGFDFFDERLNKAWRDWIEYRKEKKNPLTPTAAKKQIEFLQKYSATIAVAIIDKSIQSGWTGLFELKEQPHQVSTVKRMQL